MKLKICSRFPFLLFNSITIWLFGCSEPATKTAKYLEVSGWATSNLNEAKYRNGDSIPHVTDTLEWASLTTGAWTYYNNDSSFGPLYGRLYNWYALADPRGICPQGWHVATTADWDSLVAQFGGPSIAASHLKATTGWELPNVASDNASGFSALPSGNRKDNGIYNGLGLSGPFWTSTEQDSLQALARFMNRSHNEVGKKAGDKRNGLACRCVKNDWLTLN